jgi:hypothetical protein
MLLFYEGLSENYLYFYIYNKKKMFVCDAKQRSGPRDIFIGKKNDSLQ